MSDGDVDLRQSNARSKDDPTQNACRAFTLSRVGLSSDVAKSRPKDNFHAVDNGVGLDALPPLQLLHVRGAELVEDEHE